MNEGDVGEMVGDLEEEGIGRGCGKRLSRVECGSLEDSFLVLVIL